MRFQVRNEQAEVRALRDQLDRLQAKMGADVQASQARLQAALESAADQREALLNKFSKLFAVVRKSFEKRSAERAALEQALAESRSTATELRASLEAAVQSHRAEQDKLTKMMLGKDSEMRQLRENLHQYEDQLRGTKEEMDANVAVLKKNAHDLERDVHRLTAELRKKDAELSKLQELQADNALLRARLQQSEQQALEQTADQGKRLQDSMKRIGDLELELELAKTVLKKNTEEYRLKTERLQQNLEQNAQNIRQERDYEMTVLKDANERLQEQVLERDRLLENLKEEHSAQLMSLQLSLSCRHDDLEKITDLAETVKKENEERRSKERDLRQTIEYLEGELQHRDAVLQESERKVTVPRTPPSENGAQLVNYAKIRINIISLHHENIISYITNV